MIKISYIMITARNNNPYFNRPELHLFQPTFQSMIEQSMHEFEWVIIDANYHKRPDYFKNLQPPFPIKHVPAQPNIWLKHGLPGVSTQYNRGIIHADGELLFFTGDSYLFKQDFMKLLWHCYGQGCFPLAWYMFDNTYTDGRHKVVGDVNIKYPPEPYDICGFTGKNQVGLEHRFVKLFGTTRLKAVRGLPWLWWFGCSSASLQAMLQINGWDERFDGDKMLMDMDVGSRLDLAGYQNVFMMHRNMFLIRPLLQQKTYNLKTYDESVTIKCSKGLIGYNRYFQQSKANTVKFTEENIEWIKQVYCGNMCEMRSFCRENHPWQYPFEHKAGYLSHNSSKKWFNFWMDNQHIYDLREEREKRLDGDKYTEGTFIDA